MLCNSNTVVRHTFDVAMAVAERYFHGNELAARYYDVQLRKRKSIALVL